MRYLFSFQNITRFSRLQMILFFSLLFCTSIYGQTTIFQEDWEGNWSDNWHVDAGTWEVGAPTSGPDSAFNGNHCAATVLGGNYAKTVDARIIRHSSFIVPAATENPRLRFWHWYSFSTADYGEVQIKPTDSTNWIAISEKYTSTGSNVWTYPYIDLSDYAGQSVQIAFYFQASDPFPYNNTSTGWYIDDVSIETGTLVFNNPETWEPGLGDWSAEKGTWEVGSPSSGPNGAYNGSHCAATVLDGKYAKTVSSRLVSPTVTLPVVSENPRLRFWHWYSFSTADYGEVQIKPADSTNWIAISEKYTSTGSNVWTYPYIDLSDYAGQSVKIAFYFHASDPFPYNNTSTGWYIDDVIIEPTIPTKINQLVFENFSAYPNPTKSIINVRFVSSDKVQFSLIDMQGSVVKKEYASKGITNRVLDLSDLPQGIYLLKIFSKDQNKTVKLIKK